MIIKGSKSDYQLVVGLEVHVQLNTKNKLFSSGINNFADHQNGNVALFDIATPGQLPVVNQEAINKAIALGLAINGTIHKLSRFDRKHYFYPDLPSGYQISQFYLPIITDGTLEIEGDNDELKIIRIERAHLEQDAGKMIHDNDPKYSQIDYNRAGVPLIEIVSKPDFRDINDVVAYLKKLQAILKYLKISDADLEKGTFRCDANVSVMKVGSNEFGTRCEIKNLNSFRFVAEAIEYEAKRQVTLIEDGEIVKQETRLFNTKNGKTENMRDKENSTGYRYMPDPDLLPIFIKQEEIDQVERTLPELPDAKKKRYLEEGLSKKEVIFLCSDPLYSDYFDEITARHSIKMSATWVLTELIGALKNNNLLFEQNPVSSSDLSDLLDLISSGEINGKIAKDVLNEMIISGKEAKIIIQEKGLKQIDNDEAIIDIVKKVINDNQKQVLEYQGGNERLFAFFVGQVMKLSQGKANPNKVNEILKTFLK